MTENKFVSPNELFNELGENRFDDWSNLPLKVLGSRKNTFKLSPERYDRNKYLARQIWRKLKDYLKDPDVIIYADTATWDEDLENSEFLRWDKPFRLSCSSDLLLIEKGTGHGKKLVKREFKIEMPQGKNPLVFTKTGRNIELDVEYMKSILPKVCELIDGRITDRALAKNYAIFLKDSNIKAPKKSWINANLEPELSQLKTARKKILGLVH